MPKQDCVLSPPELKLCIVYKLFPNILSALHGQLCSASGFVGGKLELNYQLVTCVAVTGGGIQSSGN